MGATLSSEVGPGGVDTARTKGNGLAGAFLSSRVQAALTLKLYERGIGDLDLLSLIEQLQQQIQAAQEGDLAQADAMLVAQASTLNVLFNTLLRDAATSSRSGDIGLYLKYALRAQAQSRATLETLAARKRPPTIAFYGQNNVSGLQQVVNNESRPGRELGVMSEQAEEPKNKVLGAGDGERLDDRTKEKAVGTDPRMDAVVSINRAKNA